LNAHDCFLTGSAPIEGQIRVLDVRLVVDHTAVNFHPGVGLEGELLCTDDEMGGNARSLEQASGRRGTLEAKHFFPIPDACQVDGRADGADCIRSSGVRYKRLCANFMIKAGKISSSEIELETNQMKIGLQE
jgi:hypothetical protein